MAIVERMANSTAEAEGGKFPPHVWGALEVFVGYGYMTAVAARTIMVDAIASHATNTPLSGQEKSALLAFFNKIPVSVPAAGTLPHGTFEACSILVEREFITRAECKAILDR